jgi:hypothetical protein
MIYVLSRLRIRDKIINPIPAKIASNPGDFCDFGVGFTVGGVVPGVSVSSSIPPSLCGVDSEVGAALALSSSLADGADVGVGEGVGVDMDTAPVVLPPPDGLERAVGVGVGGVDDTSPEVNSPLSTVAEIALNDLSYNESISIFSGLEPVPTAVNSTFAKTMSPLAPSEFNADILVSPAVLSLLNAGTVESELPVTPVTCTIDGS